MTDIPLVLVNPRCGERQRTIPAGWRIEQKYAQGVLLGNWYENRLGKFKRGSHPSVETSQRDDFRQYPPMTYFPDVTTRRKGLLMNDGLNKDHILTHHGKLYLRNYNISSYDQDYNRKYTTGLRQWNLTKGGGPWLLERSDHPVTGESTNFGLKEEREKIHKSDRNFETMYTTEHSSTYRGHPPTQDKRMATSRHLSSHFHPHNVHKDLHFRGAPLICRPEFVNLNPK